MLRRPVFRTDRRNLLLGGPITVPRVLVCIILVHHAFSLAGAAGIPCTLRECTLSRRNVGGEAAAGLQSSRDIHSAVGFGGARVAVADALATIRVVGRRVRGLATRSVRVLWGMMCKMMRRLMCRLMCRWARGLMRRLMRMLRMRMLWMWVRMWMRVWMRVRVCMRMRVRVRVRRGLRRGMNLMPRVLPKRRAQAKHPHQR